MGQDAYRQIVTNPRFRELVAKRNRFSILLSAIVLVVYGGFVAVAVYAPGVFAAPVLGTSAWCLGLIAGFVIQAFAFVMTGIYTRRANGEFDALAQDAIRGAL